jgi:uncharacterized protein
MGLTHQPSTQTAPRAESTAPSKRLVGPDVVRAVAMAGVVTMNFHGYLINDGARRDGGWPYDLFDPWTGPLSTRFAATFVLTAGVGVTLMTRTAIGDPARTSELRWRLASRGLLLYAFGLAFDFIWAGTILPFYGAMFLLAAVMYTLRTRWLLAIGVTAAVAGWAIRWWRLERELDGHDTSWLTEPASRSPRGLVLDVFVNGTHPLLPWLAFFCAGMIVGRLITHSTRWTIGLFEIGWRPLVVAVGVALFTAGTVAGVSASGDRALVLLSTDPFERGLAYTSSALGTALVAFAVISALAERYRHTALVDALRRAGQMSLTIYIAHALVFNLLVDWLDVVDPAGLTTALSFAAIYWTIATAAAVAYHRRFGQGPAEIAYRKLTG